MTRLSPAIPYNRAITPETALRASDGDREQTADRLRCAAGEGRLLPEEFEERLQAAFAARTYGELDALVGDLPNDAPPSRPRRAASLRLRSVLPWLVALAALLLILMVAGVGMRGHVSSAAPIPPSRSTPGPPP